MPAKRSNKTARVLNLIATPGEPVAEEPAAASPAPEKAENAPAEKAKPKQRASTAKKKAATSEADAPATAVEEAAAPAESTVAEAAPEETKESKTSAPAQAQSAPVLTPVVPILQNVREKEHQLSEDIKSGLLQALSESEAASQPAEEAPTAEETSEPAAEQPAVPASEPLQPAPGAETPAQPDPMPAPTAPSEPTPAVEEAPAEPKPTANTTSPVPADPPPASKYLYTPVGEQDVVYTNVLQELVEETAPYYIDNMLQCHCKRCVADMKALALTNLPSKYVVLEQTKRAAYMSVYAARYDKLLSVQMMRACIIINDHPHH